MLYNKVLVERGKNLITEYGIEAEGVNYFRNFYCKIKNLDLF